MDWRTFFTAVIESLAWPIAAVVLVMLLRDEIRQLLPFLKRLKAGPLEAEFERNVTELRAASDVQPLPAVAEPLTPQRAMLLELVEVNPRSAILEAWRGVENEALRVIDRRGMYVRPKEANSPNAVIRTLAKENVLSSDEVALFHDLRALRNLAAHADDFSPTLDAALNFIDLAGRLQTALQRT